MELRDALSQIAEIRTQMARTEVFRGYRSVTAAFSGVVALVTAGVQSVWIAEPAGQIGGYVGLWFGAAVLCMAVVGLEMVMRSRRLGSKVQSQLTMMAVEQFLPAIGAGALVTLVFVKCIPGAATLLPGLWMVLFALGIFSSGRLLPRGAFGVGAFYLLAGLGELMMAGGSGAMGPWVMGGVFAVGQFMASGILYYSLERRYEE